MRHDGAAAGLEGAGDGSAAADGPTDAGGAGLGLAAGWTAGAGPRGDGGRLGPRAAGETARSAEVDAAGAVVNAGPLLMLGGGAGGGSCSLGVSDGVAAAAA